MSVILRRLTRDEMSGAAAVHRAAFDDALPWLAGLHTPAEDRAFFQGPVFKTCEVWGAWEMGELNAFIAFRAAWIDHLYVLPARQSRGRGGALLDVARRDQARVCLWTFQRNAPARRFSERRGFVAVSATDGTRNEEHEPDVLYEWRAAG